MKSDDTSIYDDPTTPAHVRELLQAGRRAAGADVYDVERGLAKHLAAIAATAPGAQWAPAAAAAKTGLPAWFGYVAMPLAAASVAGLLWLYSANRQVAPATGIRATSAPASAETAARSVPNGVQQGVPSDSAKAGSEQARSAATDDSDNRAGDDSRQASGERRRGVRSNAAHSGARSPRASVGSRSGDLDLNAVSAGEASAIGSKSGDLGSGSRGTTRDTNANDTTAARAAAASAPTPVAQRVAAEEPTEAPRPASTEAAAKPAAAPVVDEARLEREMQMLAVTQRVLSSDPARALRLSEQGEHEFAGSMFSAERRQLGLLALVKLGRLDEARRAGRPFLARYPKAPWSERLRRALSTGVVD